MAKSGSCPADLCKVDGGFFETEEDPFLGFVDYAISELSPEKEESKPGDASGDEGGGGGPSWSWAVSRVLKTCLAYSSGVTPAILLSDLFQAWSEQKRYLAPGRSLGHKLIPLEKRRRRSRLPNTITIDSIHEKKFISANGILEAVVLQVYVLPGTDIYMLKLGDFWSSCTIDLYLHRRYYNLVNPDNGILSEGREIFLTGCCLRTTGSTHLRLLPTDYMLILLDEDKDEDAMLLGAQFCSDSFSSITPDALKEGSSYSFYARVKAIGPVQVQGEFGCLQRRQITLEDGDGSSLDFVLWGDQTLLGNLLGVGSMLALDKPFLGSSSTDGNPGGGDAVFLEFGSATQLYLVPFVQPQKQVLITSTQSTSQRSSAPTVTDRNQDFKDSQISLPLDSQGSVDFRNYPFRLFVVNLRGRMTGVNLYGHVRDIRRDVSSTEAAVYFVTLEDPTGSIVLEMHFSAQWSPGRLNVGHTVYVTGIASSATSGNLDLPEFVWREEDSDASLIDLSRLPAVLNSPCLHKLSLLSALSADTNSTRICDVRLVEVDHRRLFSRYFHGVCGHLAEEEGSAGSLRCARCSCGCDHDLVRGFHLQVPLRDESATVLVWCAGQAAAELLQIYPDDFFELPEVEQAMYLCTLENERFIVALANTKRSSDASSNDESGPVWEIVRAQKCDSDA